MKINRHTGEWGVGVDTCAVKPVLPDCLVDLGFIVKSHPSKQMTRLIFLMCVCVKMDPLFTLHVSLSYSPSPLFLLSLTLFSACSY